MEKIKCFVNKLAGVNNLCNVQNLYQNGIQKGNLELYLTKMAQIKPTVLLLGEAPGYKGCGLTGIPFTSEKILREKSFFATGEYRISDNQWELTARIVWDELDNQSFFPLLWNIFPFHPHKADNISSNRKPCSSELVVGEKFLCELLEIFDIDHIGAVGRTAESRLKHLSMEYKYIRHPAKGGGKKFAENLETALCEWGYRK